MSLQINEDLLRDDADTAAGSSDNDVQLPDGVYPDAEWAEMKAARKLPEGRTELFGVNGRVYTAPSLIDPGVIFRYMKAVRQRDPGDSAMADLLYELLGEPVMDVLAEEKLSPEEFRSVMKVVQKHVAGATKKVMGN